MGIPILAGRSFDVHDTESSPPVVVVSERFVREFFANQSPVGRTVRNGDTSFQIVGVCGDIRFGSARAPAPPVFYRHFAQAGETGAMLLMILREVSSLTAVGTIVGLLGQPCWRGMWRRCCSGSRRQTRRRWPRRLG
jgi:hypothetical protein